MGYSLPGSSVHGLLQARILEWLSFPSAGDLPQPRIKPGLLHCRQLLYHLSHQGSPLFPDYQEVKLKVWALESETPAKSLTGKLPYCTCCFYQIETASGSPVTLALSQKHKGGDSRRLSCRKLGFPLPSLKTCIFKDQILSESCFHSAAKSCLVLYDLTHWSTPGFPVLHHFLEFAHKLIHWVSDAI